jgi:hypothetical protein
MNEHQAMREMRVRRVDDGVSIFERQVTVANLNDCAR